MCSKSGEGRELTGATKTLVIQSAGNDGHPVIPEELLELRKRHGGFFGNVAPRIRGLGWRFPLEKTAGVLLEPSPKGMKALE